MNQCAALDSTITTNTRTMTKLQMLEPNVTVLSDDYFDDCSKLVPDEDCRKVHRVHTAETERAHTAESTLTDLDGFDPAVDKLPTSITRKVSSYVGFIGRYIFKAAASILPHSSQHDSSSPDPGADSGGGIQFIDNHNPKNRVFGMLNGPLAAAQTNSFRHGAPSRRFTSGRADDEYDDEEEEGEGEEVKGELDELHQITIKKGLDAARLQFNSKVSFRDQKPKLIKAYTYGSDSRVRAAY